MKKIFIAIANILLLVNLAFATTVTIGSEYGGNNATSRNALDTDMNSWKTANGWSGSFYDIWFGTWITTTTGSNIYIPYGTSNVMQISLVDMINLSNNSTGTLSSDTVFLQWSQTLQDNAPKPQSRYTTSAPFTKYRNDNAWDNKSRNGILFTFSGAVGWFAGWFWDLETRTDWSGTAAEYRLLDESGIYITWWIVPTSASDQSLCWDPVNGSYVWCGNSTSRLIWFSNNWASLAKYLLVIVGDDDSSSGNNDGYTEHISFMWWVVSPLTNFCGDGIIQNLDIQNIAEQCDDGNNISGDGCSATCQTENLCVANSWAACQTSWNACWVYNTWVVMCDGTCSTTTIPALPTNYGNSCNIWIWACMTTWTMDCNWSCNAIALTPSVEICNNIDDNCDGQIDEWLNCNPSNTWSTETGSTSTWTNATGTTNTGTNSTWTVDTWSTNTGAIDTWNNSTGTNNTWTMTWIDNTGTNTTWINNTWTNSTWATNIGMTMTWSTGSTNTWNSVTWTTNTWITYIPNINWWTYVFMPLPSPIISISSDIVSPMINTSLQINNFNTTNAAKIIDISLFPTAENIKTPVKGIFSLPNTWVDL